GPAKTVEVAGVSFGAGNLFFPISYIFGDGVMGEQVLRPTRRAGTRF
ncbi:MAG: hypothetical protein FD127_4492, partial [Acidimicrobiaceae bacterium]